MNFKVEGEFRRAFKQTAAAWGMSMLQLLETVHTSWKATSGSRLPPDLTVRSAPPPSVLRDLNFKVAPELHREFKLMASAYGVSMQQLLRVEYMEWVAKHGTGFWTIE